MRIAIDARAYTWTGIGRYIRTLLKGLARFGGSHDYLILARRQDVPTVRVSLPPAWEVVPVEDSYYSWREQVVFGWELLRLKADLLHFTHCNAPWWVRLPYVVTVHDMTRFVFPGQVDQLWRRQVAYEALFAHTVRRARVAIVVSRATLADGQALLPGGLPRRCVVVPEGLDPGWLQPVSQAARARVRQLVGDAPYLVFVGVWMSHKNIARLLAAFRAVRRVYPTLRLVCTGQPRRGYVPMRRLVERYGVGGDVVLLGHVADSLLPALYAEAAAFIFPSLYEGFGLPPLEAMAAATPVVAANVTSVPEVLGEAAEYVNPEDVPDLTRGILRVLNDRPFRERLIERGKARVKSFSWEAMARAHVKVYEEAVG